MKQNQTALVFAMISERSVVVEFYTDQAALTNWRLYWLRSGDFKLSINAILQFREENNFVTRDNEAANK